MRPNTLKDLWSSGRAAVNGWCAIPSSWSAELMAHAGWDSVTLDLQHGLIDYSTALPMLQAISTTSTIPLARVPWNEPGIIMKLLDAGAYGIICPMINSREECERFVGACRYAPMGYRSNGPTRAVIYAGDDYQPNAADHILTFAMVETGEAIKNLDAIVSTPGLNGVYVGPSDLSLSMQGKPRMDLRDDEMLPVLDAIAAACKKYGVIAGIHCNDTDYANFIIERGYQFVTIRSDGALLSAIAKQAVAAVKGAAAKATTSSGPY